MLMHVRSNKKVTCGRVEFDVLLRSYRPSFAVPSRSPHQNRRTIGVEVSENILHAVSQHQLARRRSQVKSGAVNLLKSPHHCYREDLGWLWGFVVRWR